MVANAETVIPVGDITLARGSSFTLLIQFNAASSQEYLLVDLTSGDPVYRKLDRVFVEGTEYFSIDDSADDFGPISIEGVLVFIATWPDAAGAAQELRKSTEVVGSGLTIVAGEDGQAQLVLTPEETRDFPTGRIAKFEIEHRASGTEKVIGRGYINAIGGVNDDA